MRAQLIPSVRAVSTASTICRSVRACTSAARCRRYSATGRSSFGGFAVFKLFGEVVGVVEDFLNSSWHDGHRRNLSQAGICLCLIWPDSALCVSGFTQWFQLHSMVSAWYALFAIFHSPSGCLSRTNMSVNFVVPCMRVMRAVATVS
jgi:hypothetical protein